MNISSKRRISKKTKAIVPVHYGGIGAEMDCILKVARAHKIAIVEDNAHGLFGSYDSKPLGSFGGLAALSFHETKNVSCGEGGALILNDASLLQGAEILRDKGTNREKFLKGEVDSYTWVDVGLSLSPSDFLAAFLLAQLESHQTIQKKRMDIWTKYAKELHSWSVLNHVQLPHVPSKCEPSYHMFFIVLPSGLERDRFIEHMKSKRISCVFHYQALNASPMGIKWGGRAGDCPVAERASKQLVRLPFFNELTDDLQQRVIDAVKAFSVGHRQKEAA